MSHIRSEYPIFQLLPLTITKLCHSEISNFKMSMAGRDNADIWKVLETGVKQHRFQLILVLMSRDCEN